MLQALAGYDAADPASSREPVPDYAAGAPGGVRGLRIGVPRDYFFLGREAGSGGGLRVGHADLARARRRRPRGDHPQHLGVAAFMVIMLTEAFAYHARDLRERPQIYGEVLRDGAHGGRPLHRRGIRAGERLRARLCEDVNVLGEVDLLATPTTLVTAPSFSAVYDPDFPFGRSNMAPFNMSGTTHARPALRLRPQWPARCHCSSRVARSTRPRCSAPATPTNRPRTGTLAGHRNATATLTLDAGSPKVDCRGGRESGWAGAARCAGPVPQRSHGRRPAPGGTPCAAQPSRAELSDLRSWSDWPSWSWRRSLRPRALAPP